MVVFHARWDLAWLGVVGTDGAVGPAWQAFGNAVAAAFLLLAGASLVLADRRGTGRADALRRLAGLGAVALAITAATALAVPRLIVLCGILHCIAVGCALTLPLLRAPRWAAAGVACLLFALPLLPLPTGWDGRAAGWFGLGQVVPDSLDYRPLAPWAGFVPLGAALVGGVPERWLAGHARVGALRWAGRHSLLVYLTHQAVLYPSVALLAFVLGVRAPAADWATTFDRQCCAGCEATGAAPALCRSTCACARRNAVAAGLDRAGADPAGDHGRLAAVTAACFGRDAP